MVDCTRQTLSRLLSAAGYEVRAFESADRFSDEPDVDIPGCYANRRATFVLLASILPSLRGGTYLKLT